MFTLRLIDLAEITAPLRADFDDVIARRVTDKRRAIVFGQQRESEIQTRRREESVREISMCCSNVEQRYNAHVRYMALAVARQLAEQANEQLDIAVDRADADKGDDRYCSDSDETDTIRRYMTNWAKLLTSKTWEKWRDDTGAQQARLALTRKQARLALTRKYSNGISSEALDLDVDAVIPENSSEDIELYFDAVIRVTECTLAPIVATLTEYAQGIVDDPHSVWE
jgi:hypothetical protein